MLLEFALLSIFCFTFFKWYTWNYSYWRAQSVPSLDPIFPFGNIADAILMRKTVGEVYRDIYRRFPGEPAVGITTLRDPALLLRDPELIKAVLVKDFNSFHDNGFEVSQEVDPLFGINPFVSKGEKWKKMRAIHTPVVSVAKLKAMVPELTKVANMLTHYLMKHENEDMEAQELCSLYTMDAVVACAFGLDVNSFEDPNETFRKNVPGNLFTGSFQTNLTSFSAMFAPKVGEIFGWRLLTKQVEHFFVEMVKKTRYYRKENGIKRNDLLQHLIDTTKPDDKPVYTDLEMAGHCMTFFLDGYETSSIFFSFVLFELARNQDIQNKLREEIIQTLGNKDISYDDLETLPLLQAVTCESLRMHPPIQSLSKLCTREITLSKNGREFRIKPGVRAIIPVYALHTDEFHYSKPDQFKPERFNESFNKFAFLPFGEGPRICIGFRFALTQVKIAVISILREYAILPAKSVTTIDELNPMNTFVHTFKSGVWVRFHKL